MGSDEDLLSRLTAKRQAVVSHPPLPAASLDSLLDDFALRHAHATAAIEGNTLTLDQVQAVLEQGVTIPGKSLREHLEVVNAHDTWRWIRPLAGRAPLTEPLVLETQRRLMQGILPEAEAGTYRRVPVYISGSWHVPPNWVKIPDLMADWIQQYAGGSGAEHPVPFAARAHIDLVRLHPLRDGNGRTARMLTNFLLMQMGYPPAHYAAEARERYLAALRQFDQSHDPAPFTALTGEAVEWMMDRWLALLEQVQEGEDESGAPPRRPTR